MKLHISRLPQSYTAQQLLKLFQKRYPSVYKTRIFKAEDEEEGGEGDRSDDGEKEVKMTCDFLICVPRENKYRKSILLTFL